MSECRSQTVSTNKQRKQVTNWMIQQVANSGSAKKQLGEAVEIFPSIFRVTDTKSQQFCVKKAYRRFLNHDQF